MADSKTTAKMFEAARQLAQGADLAYVALKYKVSDQTIRKWMKDPDTRAIYLDAFKDEAVLLVARAMEVLKNLIRDDALPYVQLQAAQAILAQFKGELLGEKKEMTITVTGDVPNMGMPAIVEDFPRESSGA